MPRSAASLARLLPAPDPAPADVPLLRAFAATRSAGAFEELVRRHGPMVLATCLRVLGNPDDAEDAFQAVFLVLARKASTVRGNLAGWLYAVSVRTARGVRIMRERRRKHETRASARSESVALPESDHDLAAVIDEELARLPEHYREAVVLCELRGLSRKQAASELGIPEGTLSSRLAVARRKLAALLSARGLAPAAVLALLAPASVSAGLVESAVTAVRGTAGPVASAAASAVVKAMLFDQLKAVALAAGILLTVVCGGFAMTGNGRGEQPAPAAPAPRLVDPAAKLVEQLGAPEFADREAAQKKLRELGMKAESALRAGYRSENPEVRTRSAKVLAEIRKDALAALVKGFDPAKAEQPDHPVWKHFVAIAGDSKASRELFARIIANEKWLQTLDKAEADPAKAGHVYRVGIAEMFRDFDKDPAKSPPWPCDRPEEVAYLLLLGSYPDDNPPAKLTGDEVVPTNLRHTTYLGRGIISGEGQILHATGLELGLKGKIRFFNVSEEIVGAAGTDRVFGKLFAAWLAQRSPSAEVVPNAFRIAATYRATEVLPIARRYAANDFEPKRDIPPLATIMALQLVAQHGTRADLPLFERHFGDETNVAAVDKRRDDGALDYHRPAPLKDTTQLRDVALGLALLLHGANPEDFGFVVRKDTFIKQKDGRYTIPWSTQLHLGFDSEARRTAAFKKARAWLAEQKPKVEPPVAPKPDPEVEKLLKQLGAAAFADREAAAQQLRALGARAEPALKAALTSDDPEIRQRAPKILAEIRGDLLQALVKEFDPAKEKQPDHPIWKRFKTIAGDTRAARDLFAGVIKNPNWLRRLDAAEANPDVALRQYQEAVIEVGKALEFNLKVSFKIPVWPCDRGEEVAFLLLLGSYPNTASIPPGNDPGRRQFDAGEGRIHFARGLELGLQGKILDSGPGFQPEPVKAADGTDRVFAKLLAAWLEHREPAADVVPDSLWLAARHGAKEVLPFARIIAADKFPHAREPSRRLYAAALAVVARVGAREDLPLFEKYFKDELVIATFELEDEKTGSKGATQLRDAAFGLALVLHGEDPAKYGFVIAGRRWTQTYARTVVGEWDPCAFGFLNGDDKSRLAAHVKVKAFLDKQPKP